MHCSVLPNPISSARIAPYKFGVLKPTKHSYKKTTPSRWWGRKCLLSKGSTTTSTMTVPRCDSFYLEEIKNETFEKPEDFHSETNLDIDGRSRHYQGWRVGKVISGFDFVWSRIELVGFVSGFKKRQNKFFVWRTRNWRRCIPELHSHQLLE